MEDIGHLGADLQLFTVEASGLIHTQSQKTWVGIMRLSDILERRLLIDQRNLYGDRAPLLEPRKGGVVPGSLIKDIPDEVLTNVLSLGDSPSCSSAKAKQESGKPAGQGCVVEIWCQEVLRD